MIELADGSITSERFPSKTERNKWLAENAGAMVLSEEEEIIPEPIENALASVKRLLREIAEELGSDDVHLILSESFGKGNFRHAIAKQAPYKGNRKQPRPYHYQNIRDYMVAYQGAQIVETREADDELSIRAARYREQGIPYAIASIDKDLDQIPGRHYDYAKKVVYTVSAEDGRRAFWIQALAGDPTDNIPGAWKIGPTRAAGVVDNAIASGGDDSHIFSLIVGSYTASKVQMGCPYKDRPAVEVALETAQLVYLQQKPCELWAPPGVPFGKIGCEIDD